MTPASELSTKLRAISALITDVDGCLTDGYYVFGAEGEQFKRFSTRDDVGIHLALVAAWPVVFLTQRKSPMVEAFGREAGVTRICQGVSDKRTAVAELLKSLKLKREQVAYLGDDLLDLPAMGLCGLSVAPADAALLVRQKVDLVLDLPGGRGALRELVERALEAQGRLCTTLHAYYRDHGCDEPGELVPPPEQDERGVAGKIGFRQ